jgi:predicted glycosyltransferase
MPYRTVEVEVDYDLEEFDDYDLIQELEERGYVIFKEKDALNDLYESYVLGDRTKFDKTLSNIFYEQLGKII